ncbi:MAG: YqgE/AlgH family protein [Flavobacteriia bacterium]|nr:YqgE/AlgH family protein [Flavobacteriia bacterium]
MKKLDLSFKNNRKATQGCLLLSDPFINDPYFTRVAILLCRHNKKETFGFVLNNFIELDLQKIGDIFGESPTKISIGGPVEPGNLFYIHTLGDKIKDAENILGNLYFGGDYESLRELLDQEPSLLKDIRFFIGYAGWDYQQLEDEMKEHSWVAVTNITENEIISMPSDDFWKQCMIKQGPKFQMISQFPLDPNDN